MHMKLSWEFSAVPVLNQNRSTLPVRALLHSATFFYPVYFFITHLFNCTPFAVLLASSEVAFDAYQHLSNTVQPFFCCFFHWVFFVCLPRCHSWDCSDFLSLQTPISSPNHCTCLRVSAGRTDTFPRCRKKKKSQHENNMRDLSPSMSQWKSVRGVYHTKTTTATSSQIT